MAANLSGLFVVSALFNSCCSHAPGLNESETASVSSVPVAVGDGDDREGGLSSKISGLCF